MIITFDSVALLDLSSETVFAVSDDKIITLVSDHIDGFWYLSSTYSEIFNSIDTSGSHKVVHEDGDIK